MLSFNITAEIDCERSERSIFLLQMVSDTFAADHPMQLRKENMRAVLYHFHWHSYCFGRRCDGDVEIIYFRGRLCE